VLPLCDLCGLCAQLFESLRRKASTAPELL
jgi:hypothetical protein